MAPTAEAASPTSNKSKWTVTLEALDRGFEVTCRTQQKKESISVRHGWVPAKWDEKRAAFPTLKAALAYIEDSLDEKIETKKEK